MPGWLDSFMHGHGSLRDRLDQITAIGTLPHLTEPEPRSVITPHPLDEAMFLLCWESDTDDEVFENVLLEGSVRVTGKVGAGKSESVDGWLAHLLANSLTPDGLVTAPVIIDPSGELQHWKGVATIYVETLEDGLLALQYLRDYDELRRKYLSFIIGNRELPKQWSFTLGVQIVAILEDISVNLPGEFEDRLHERQAFRELVINGARSSRSRGIHYVPIYQSLGVDPELDKLTLYANAWAFDPGSDEELKLSGIIPDDDRFVRVAMSTLNRKGFALVSNLDDGRKQVPMVQFPIVNDVSSLAFNPNFNRRRISAGDLVSHHQLPSEPEVMALVEAMHTSYSDASWWS